MPFAENQGTKIFYDEEGAGEPVLLIMGLGYPAVMWFRTRPFLAERYRTIAFDNRGVGRSDYPPGPYLISGMAADAGAVLDACECESAHLYGVSMGGMIAQEFALQHPGRVRSLILGCTAAGGPQAVRAEPEVIEFLRQRASVDPAEAVDVSIPYLYDPATPRALIDEDVELRNQWPPKPESYLAQLQGIFAWEAYSRLDQISVPTLVIHGESDRLIPFGNGELIAERIPGARLVRLRHAGHMYTTDQGEEAQAAILEFLAAQTHASSAGTV